MIKYFVLLAFVSGGVLPVANATCSSYQQLVSTASGLAGLLQFKDGKLNMIEVGQPSYSATDAYSGVSMYFDSLSVANGVGGFATQTCKWARGSINVGSGIAYDQVVDAAKNVGKLVMLGFAMRQNFSGSFSGTSVDFKFIDLKIGDGTYLTR